MGVHHVQNYVLRYDLDRNRPWIIVHYKDGFATKNVNMFPPPEDAVYYAQMLREEAPVYYVESLSGRQWLTTSTEMIGEEESPLANPALPGEHSVTTVVYAASGLDYGGSLTGYHVFHNPTEAFTTRRIDVSDFGDLGGGASWPFDNPNVPINGLLRIPSGNGPFPLVLFAHGNHSPMENSTPGYVYLCELLASRGFLAATIDVNFLNGWNSGENDGRAIVHLEHVKQFKIWNEQVGHPLRGKIDMKSMLLVGHSRGGEAVGHASLFNRLDQVQPTSTSPLVSLDGSHGLGPYKFALRGILAIAPTDGQYQPIDGPTDVKDPYLLIHGSRDGDVYNFPGYKTYDRSHAVDLSAPADPAPAMKTLVWIHGANHNYFNSTWAQESSTANLTRADQERIAKVYISAFAESMLRDNTSYVELLRDHQIGIGQGWLGSSTKLVTQFHSRSRRIIQHFESGGSLAISPPVTGTVEMDGVTAEKLLFNLGGSSHLFQETVGLRMTWNSETDEYRLTLDPTTLGAAEFEYLTLRAGQSFEADNPAGAPQDFTIELADASRTLTMRVSQWGALLYPDTSPAYGSPKTVMQTFHIPLGYLRAESVEPTDIREITFRFDRVATGRLYLDDIALSA